MPLLCALTQGEQIPLHRATRIGAVMEVTEVQVVVTAEQVASHPVVAEVHNKVRGRWGGTEDSGWIVAGCVCVCVCEGESECMRQFVFSYVHTNSGLWHVCVLACV